MGTRIGPHTVLDETTYNSPNYTPAGQVASVFGQARTIAGVTVHWWGDPSTGPSFGGVASYLSRQGGDTSAHFVVEAGRAACLVSPQDAAWHAGNATGNATTIGIECNPRCSEADLQSLVELIAWLESEYGSLNVYGHHDWTTTTCPGVYYGHLAEIIDRVNAYEGNTTAPANSSTGMEAAIQWFQDRAGQVTYSMTYRDGPSSYDCSSSVYYALISAGLLPVGTRIGSTESEFGDLEAHGWTKVPASADGSIPAQRGDIFIWGDRGASEGAAGHTGIFVDADNIIHCNYGYNTISVNNHDAIWGANGSPTCTIYRLSKKKTTQAAALSGGDWFDMATTADLEKVVERVFDKKLNEAIPRQGAGAKGTTSIRAMVAWLDKNLEDLRARQNASNRRLYRLDSMFRIGIPGIQEDGFAGQALRRLLKYNEKTTDAKRAAEYKAAGKKDFR